MAFSILINANDFNSGLLLETGRAQWGGALLAVNPVQQGDPPAVGQPDTRPIVAAEFVFAGGAVVSQAEAQALFDAHNPQALSAEQSLRQRAASARATLKATGANGARATPMPQLAELVALVIEALGMDV